MNNPNYSNLAFVLTFIKNKRCSTVINLIFI